LFDEEADCGVHEATAVGAVDVVLHVVVV